ncbi:malate/L-lactate dehydrogenase [Apiospora hydei]|uniref:Malate/L-lactate dehydrogenase n=1 Tax=Apiospora hydei TaxID=1337664 RepID=A0ABR1W9I9_9PEZI
MATPTEQQQPKPAAAAAEEEETRKLYVTAADAQAFTEAVLRGNGAPADHARTVAECLVAADLRGVDTHGVNRLPSYMARVRSGVLDAAAVPTLAQVTPAAAQVDGHNTFGAVAGAWRCKLPSTWPAFKHSNHFGMSAWLVQKALDEGMMSLVFTNSSPRAARLLGVSPIACGAPGGDDESPFILDMAPSVAARGKVYKAKRRGEKIPLDWALDAEGRPTDDPAAALEGVMLPMGGPKGSALAIMMDVFSGVFSGSAFAGHVTNPYDPSRPADVGHFLVAIKPDLFMPLADFRERMRHLYDRVVKESEPAAGVDRVYFPGEIEQRTERERRRAGIPYVEAEVRALNEEAQRVGADAIRVTADGGGE